MDTLQPMTYTHLLVWLIQLYTKNAHLIIKWQFWMTLYWLRPRNMNMCQKYLKQNYTWLKEHIIQDS